MTFLLWLTAVGLVVVIVWLLISGSVEVVLTRAQRQDHEAFWGDGQTGDGTWAVALHGSFGAAVQQAGEIEPSREAVREIWTRDSIGRRRDPARVRAHAHHPSKRPGARLHPEAVGAPETP